MAKAGFLVLLLDCLQRRERKAKKKKNKKKTKRWLYTEATDGEKKIKTTERTILLLYDLFKVVMQLINFYITVE